MTFAHVGTTQSWDTGATHSYTPGGVGRLVVFCYITKLATTPMPTGLSASNITWSRLTSDFATSVAATPTGASIWIGVTTSTSPANTTITWSGAEPAHWEAEVNEFTSTVGSWALDTSAGIDANGGNHAYPSLTPAGAGELYVGMHYDDSGAVAGSTSGYTYHVTSHGNGALYNAACSSSTQAPTWAGTSVMGGIAALIKESSPDSGTAAVTLKKMRVSACNPHYATGTGGFAGQIPHTSNLQVTIPSDVNDGDLMVVGYGLFTWTANPNPVPVMTPSAGAWTQIDIQRDSPANSALKEHGKVFVKKADLQDPGSTLTFTATADSYGQDEFWHTVVLASYAGLDESQIVSAGTSGYNSVRATVLTPEIASDTDGMWGIYVGPLTPNAGQTILSGPTGTTIRQNEYNSGANCAIADTGGSVGPRGTRIGGKGNNWSVGNAAVWWASFTLGVAQKTASPANSVTAELKKMSVAGTGTVTGTFTSVYNSSSGGVDSYDVTSQANGTGSHTMRVIKPTNPDPHYPHAFLYMLPVEAAGGSTYGDPISNATALGLANTYNLTIISPGYAIDPWYADNPSDATILQETFTVWVTDWVKANLAISGTEKHYLIGFSKSGIGGADLIFRHPSLFEKAVLWDTPADDNAYNRFTPDDADVYGTAGNFTNNYELSSDNLSGWNSPFTSSNRIWVASGVTYGSEVVDWDNLMTSLGIQHSFDGTTFASDSHAWHDDWILAGLSSILNQVSSGHVTMKKMTVSASAPIQTLFGQADLGITIGSSDVTEYTLGMEFSLSKDAPLAEIWFYSPATATGLPVGAAIWDINANAIVSGTQNDSPVWSAAAASGWVKVVYDRSVVLTAGTKYSVAIKKNTTGLVYGLTPHYWDTTGAGASGKSSGIISAPNDVSAVHGQDAFTTGASWALPNGSFNAANYGIDVGVVIPPTSGGSSIVGTGVVTLKKMTVSGTATAPLAGTADVTLKKMTTFGSGKAMISGTISVSLRKMTTSGFGFAPVFGTISVTMLKMEVRASDHVPEASPLFLFSQF